MFLPMLLLLPALAAIVLANEDHKVHYAPIYSLTYKRQLMTCEQTYGIGSQRCGSVSSTFCYNPAQGQNEDLETCARNAGFTLPQGVAGFNGTNTSKVDAAVTLSPTVTVSPFIIPTSAPQMTPLPVTIVTPEHCSTTSAEPVVAAQPPSTSMTTSMAVPVPTVSMSNMTALPTVQVSLAVRLDPALFGVIVMIGVTGIFPVYI
ncbi:hypothetical protein F5Y15DRAFT_431236 [Xylariaceae sp. FL0016]|nr:hypothetical protein F5Y15DRAFT_431236 [Xylariaceae sp. FL0016]